MMKTAIAILVGFMTALACSAAHAQATSGARVVTSCGTAPFTYTVGQTVPILVDINGNLCGANGGSGGTPTPVTPAACAWTYTSVTLAAATSATILAAGSYKGVVIMNMGANPLNRFASGTSPITASSAGFALDPPSNVQGGSYAFPLPPTTAVQAISTLGTTVTVGICT